MEDLVKKTKQNTVLNALWYAEKWSYDKNNIKLCDIYGPGSEISGNIGQLIFGKYRLILTYTGQEYSLASHFESDEVMQDFINKNVDSLFSKIIKKYDEYIYTLNVVTVTELNDYHNRLILKPYMQHSLDIFMPIIQKFMADALTDNFYIMEEGELVKQ